LEVECVLAAPRIFTSMYCVLSTTSVIAMIFKSPFKEKHQLKTNDHVN